MIGVRTLLINCDNDATQEFDLRLGQVRHQPHDPMHLDVRAPHDRVPFRGRSAYTATSGTTRSMTPGGGVQREGFPGGERDGCVRGASPRPAFPNDPEKQ